MTANKYKNILQLAPLWGVGGLIFLFSCLRSDIPPENNEQGELRVHLTIPEVADTDQHVRTLRILIFVGEHIERNLFFDINDNGTIDENNIAAGINIIDVGEATDDDFHQLICVSVVTGPKTVFAIANETAEMGLGNIHTISQLTGITFGKAEIIDPETGEIQEGGFLPMTGRQTTMVTADGHPDNGHTDYDSRTNRVNIELTTAVARIELMFDNMTEHEVIITEVALLNNTQRSWLRPNGDTLEDGQTFGSLIVAIENGNLEQQGDTIPASAEPKLQLDPIYVLENPRERGAGNYSTETNRATLLRVTALIEGDEIIYFAPIGINTNTGVVDGRIERGLRYSFYGRIWVDHLDRFKLKVRVNDWYVGDDVSIPLGKEETTE
jgi:hypothetical protein